MTFEFTRDQINTLLGALNSASVARRRQAKRSKRQDTVHACESIARDQDDLFVLIVRARQATEARVS